MYKLLAMIKHPVIFILISIICCLLPTSAFAQDLVYQPKNPAFGGDTFNYQWLLESAQSQNLLERERDDPFSFSTQSSIDDFTESLNRQLLSQISRQIVTAQFGEDGLEEGVYTVGNFQIDVASGLDGLTITILDTALGEQTQVIIPFF